MSCYLHPHLRANSLIFARLGGRACQGKSTSKPSEKVLLLQTLRPKSRGGIFGRGVPIAGVLPLPRALLPVRGHVEVKFPRTSACDRAVLWFGTLRPQFFLTWDPEAMSCFLKLSVFVFPWRAGITSP